jgi:hypothetical protein
MPDLIQLADDLLAKAKPHLTDAQYNALVTLAPSLITVGVGGLDILRTQIEANADSLGQAISDHLSGGNDILASWDSLNGTWQAQNVVEAAARKKWHEFTADAIEAIKVAVPIAIKLLVAV